MLGLSVLVLCVLTAADGGAVLDKPYYDVSDRTYCLSLFEDFIRTYNKIYYSEVEKNARFEIFLESLTQINLRNSLSRTSVHDITRFADLTEQEFIDMHTGFRPYLDDQPTNVVDVLNISLSDVPDSFDWRDRKVLTEVKNQGQCGSCWAFSVIGNIESHYAMKYNKLLEFSEQQLVSCDRYSDGCGGGYLIKAFESILTDMGGVELEEDYPYVSGDTMQNGECEFDPSKIQVRLANYTVFNLKKITEDGIKALLYKTGPLSIALAAVPLMGHGKGIVDLCDDDNVNHAVLLVGYGEENGEPFWTIKNSWGKAAGEDGYFRIKRGVNCLSFMDNNGVTSEVK